MFTNIKNGQLAKRSCVYQKKKKLCESFLQILWDEGFILGYKTSRKDQNNFKIFLKYFDNENPVITNIKFVSKPGRRIYYSVKQIWKIDSSKVFVIFSTNKGIKTLTDCKKYKLGGEPIIILN
jgi:small subunit ribosomal protein S8